jgi:hypothetical protein
MQNKIQTIWLFIGNHIQNYLGENDEYILLSFFKVAF